MPPSSQVRFHRPAIFGCCVTGCSRTFKSEPSLRRHQTNKHTVPEALRPQWHPHIDIQDVDLEPPPHLYYADTQRFGTPPPRYETVGGFCMERHPVRTPFVMPMANIRIMLSNLKNVSLTPSGGGASMSAERPSPCSSWPLFDFPKVSEWSEGDNQFDQQ